MTTPNDRDTPTNGVVGEPNATEELEADIERTRERLGQTAQAIADRIDVRARVRHQLQRVGARMRHVASRTKGATVDYRDNPSDVVPAVAAAVAVALGAVVMIVVRSRRT